ncbi:MAG: hypothetical protein LBB56_00305 [Chitinispirillales bacterium]|jgi:HD-GYP domain-containing protein (c-di-GMP phosphodiesterase class II)|nr:hypothetical protein [Chitinispirillales bacterium]
MVRYNIDELDEEMVLGESIFLPSGEMLLAAGYRIKERYRERLRQMGYKTVLVQVEGTEDVIPEDTITQESQREMSAALNESSKELAGAMARFRVKSNEHVKDVIAKNRQYLSKYIMTSGMGAALQKFIDEIVSQGSVVLNMSAMQQACPDLLSHAMNVTIASLCIGRKFKFSYDEMKQLGIGALHYDIGLIVTPPEIIAKKPCERTEEEKRVYAQHTSLGYVMLTENASVPATSAAVVLQHHERQDGGGYPLKLKGDNGLPVKDISRRNMIHRFAEIVMVANTYDMLTTGRDTDKKLCVRDSIKELIKMSGAAANAEVVKALVSIVPLYPVGAQVRIVNAPRPEFIGFIAVIAKNNPEHLESPQIILFQSKLRQKIKPIMIDLAKHKGFELELLV